MFGRKNKRKIELAMALIPLTGRQQKVLGRQQKVFHTHARAHSRVDIGAVVSRSVATTTSVFSQLIGSKFIRRVLALLINAFLERAR